MIFEQSSPILGTKIDPKQEIISTQGIDLACGDHTKLNSVINLQHKERDCSSKKRAKNSKKMLKIEVTITILRAFYLDKRHQTTNFAFLSAN